VRVALLTAQLDPRLRRMLEEEESKGALACISRTTGPIRHRKKKMEIAIKAMYSVLSCPLVDDMACEVLDGREGVR